MDGNSLGAMGLALAPLESDDAERTATRPTRIGISANRRMRPRLEPVDVLAQRELDVAQLLPGAQHLGAEIVDRRRLLRGQYNVPRPVVLKSLIFASVALSLVLELALWRCSGCRRRAGYGR